MFGGNKMKVVRNPKSDPEWDVIGIACTDFHPHWDGDLVNVWSCMSPAATRAETESLLVDRTREMASWILNHRSEFGPGDKFQLILGWPESIRKTGRQIIKAGGDYDALARIVSGVEPVVTRPGWDKSIFEETTAEPSSGANAASPCRSL
jgi:hypothetical protein